MEHDNETIDYKKCVKYINYVEYNENILSNTLFMSCEHSVKWEAIWNYLQFTMVIKKKLLII